MGNALYSVTKLDFRQGTRNDMLQRALTYGYRVQDAQYHLSNEISDWSEVRIRIQSLQSGVQVYWDLLFLFRVLDEGLNQAALAQSHFSVLEPFPISDSPIADIMGGHENLWSDNAVYAIEEEDFEVWIPEIHFPEPSEPQELEAGPARVELTLFLPSSWVEGLAMLPSWESAAWPDREALTYEAGAYIPAPRPAEVRLIEPDYFIDGDAVHFRSDGDWHRLTETLWERNIRDFAWDHNDNLCLVNDEGWFQLSPDLTQFEEKRHEDMELSGKAIFSNAKGELWLGNKSGVHKLFPDSKAYVTYNSVNGFPSDYIREFVPSTEGRFAILSAEGVSSYHRQEGFSHFPSSDDIAALAVDGSTWSGGKWTLKHHPKDVSQTTREYTEDHGIEDPLCALVPLPDNSIMVLSVGNETKRVAPGEHFLESYTWLNRIAPEGISCGTLTEEHVVWLVTRHNHLVKLQEGLPARLFVWSRPLPTRNSRRESFSKIRIAPDGSLYLLDSAGLCVLSQAHLQKVEKGPPSNQDRLHALPLQIFGPNQEEIDRSRQEWVTSLEEEASVKKPFFPNISRLPDDTKLPPPLPQDKERLRRLIACMPEISASDWENGCKAHLQFHESGGSEGRWSVSEVAGFLLGTYETSSPAQGKQLNISRRKLSQSIQPAGRELSSANFSSAMLEDLDFTGARLRNSLFVDAFLRQCDFTDADAQYADFSRADLQHACFSHADLRNANFAFADLRHADFRGAQLEGAVFTGAYITGAVFENEII
ncbi:MAG: pentapeptide repeat-containing protein [Deltaproteobacteria bacterium]|nr:MAG: pentapeptide repeat-containing protein [Deltaproteobacteria bacterium]